MDRPYDEVRRELEEVAQERGKLGLMVPGHAAREAELWEREAGLWRELDTGLFDRAVCYARMYAEDRAAWYRANAQSIESYRAARAEP